MIDENVNKIKDILIIMIKSGAFQVKNGKVTMNFNQCGELMNIQVEQYIYKKLKPNDNETNLHTIDEHLKQGLKR
jgi:hypothetical protein